MTGINSIISPSAADNFCCHAAEQKWQHLLQYLRSHAADGLLVALSGGVDSAVLLSAAQHAGITPLRSASINSCFITTDELENARAVAKFVNVPHSVLTLEIILDEFTRVFY